MDSFEKIILNTCPETGREWLSQISKEVQKLETLWGLNQLKPFKNLSYNYVSDGYQNKTPVVLKLSPDAVSIDREARALEAFAGYGAVAVLGRQNNALLLQRAVPGNLLNQSLSPEDGLRVACSVAKILHDLWAFVETPDSDLPWIAKYFSLDLTEVVQSYYVHLILAARWGLKNGLDAKRFLDLANAVLPRIGDAY